MDEFKLINTIRRSFDVPGNITGIGDDCAVIPQEEGFETLVSTDMLVEGVHFLFDGITPFQLGWKSAAVNFSDIAAMGGTPTGSLLAFSLPEKARGAWVADFIDGYRQISERFGVPLIGGDTTAAEEGVSICVTVLGKSPAGKSKKRSSARAGDLVCVTGCIGDSAGGLHVILSGKAQEDRRDYEQTLVRKHCEPVPRIAEGLALASEEGVRAMMDISDGLASDIRHIMEESGVGAEIDTGSLPVSDELRRLCEAEGLDLKALALGGGEDYELLFTVDPSAEKNLPVAHHVVGRIIPGKELIWNDSDKEYEGLRHF